MVTEISPNSPIGSSYNAVAVSLNRRPRCLRGTENRSDAGLIGTLSIRSEVGRTRGAASETSCALIPPKTATREGNRDLVIDGCHLVVGIVPGDLVHPFPQLYAKIVGVRHVDIRNL